MISENKKKSRGYTLVEMMVVIAIVGVFSAFVISSFSGSQATWALDTSSRELVAIIRQAQNNAVTGRYLQAGEIPCRYGVAKVSANQYKLYYKYRLPSDPSDCSVVSSSDIMTYTLRGGATFQSFPSSAEYSLPRGDIGSGMTITLQDAPATALNVCVSNNGMVIGGTTQVCP